MDAPVRGRILRKLKTPCAKGHDAKYKYISRENPNHVKCGQCRIAVEVKRYGISFAEYETLLKLQGHVCAICKSPERAKNGRLAVDHCHATGRVRGLLCRKCNTGIAFFHDKPEVLASAVSYLLAGLR
jgi:hypothetical protein